MMNLRFARLIPLFVLICLFSYRCDRGGSDAQVVENVTAIPAALQAHTSGVIGRKEAVFVQFTETPSLAAEQLISLQPTVAGTAILNGTGLSFKPENAWAAGTNYTVTVQIPDGNPYTFTFTTPERRAEVISEGLVISEDNKAALSVAGSVITNDDATQEEVSKLLSAAQNGKSLDVVVEAGTDARHFSYTVLAPDRGKEPAPVIITYDGGRAGFAGTKGEISVAIPADDDFRVESLTVENLAETSLLARFTDRLDAKQDFKGLITFSTPTKFKTKVSGNLLYIYPQADNLGNVQVNLTTGIKSATGYTLQRETNWNLSLGRTEPNLRSVGNGTILPHQGRRLFPFEAIGLRSVRLELVEIYPNNVQQYLQDSGLGDTPNDWSLRRIGKMIVQEKIDLSTLSTAANASRWTRYALDLGEYIKDDASAIYQVRLGFGMEDAAAGCDQGPEDFGMTSLDDRMDEDFVIGFKELNSWMGDYYGIHGYYDDYNWRERDDPCKPAYYNSEHFISQNIISSNLGLIAKRNPDRSTVVVTTDLINASPREGVTVRAYSFQQQELFSGQTNSLGMINMTTEERPAFITAELGNDVAYLKLEDAGLTLSRFDIGGVSGAGGIKGAFYTERGVWRPGDSVFLHFVLEDRQQRLPQNYPVEFVLTDAQSRVVERRNITPSFSGGQLYSLVFQTKNDDPTGVWSAAVIAGGKTYNCPLSIETVKPNRLSIDLELPAGGIRPAARNATLVSKWLYGAPASNLNATVEVTYTSRPPSFSEWSDFRFYDPARKLQNNGPEPVFDGELDAAGKASIQLPATGARLPGPLYAGLSTKVFEPGGNFSIDNQRIPYDPYSVYTGIDIPEDKWGYKRVSLDGNTSVDLAAVNTDGKGVSGRKLTVGLYRVDWRYWWQDNNDNVARFNGSQHTKALETYTATTGSDGSATVSVSISRWGRYLLRACDADGHCTGEYFYGGYRQDVDDRESASLLKLRAEEEEVQVGQRVKINVPSSAGGSLLVSLETGAGTIEQFWVDAEAGETDITFEADERMVPTVYANVTMLQPYEQTTNDRPIRLYGVLPIGVKDPATMLEPSLEVADEWAPEEQVTVAVKESNGKPMTYTLAVVDEGLLGLTRFQTPDLHDRFFAKEALSVRSFDLYRHVIGSLNGEYGKVLAIGGGDGGEEEETQTANRFEPVVRHLGPFRLPAGKTGRHKVQLPNYVGAVRVMVVANGDRAYGSTDKRIPVVQPLMLLPTLPRVLGPGETVDMPVNVFAMNDKVKNVQVQVAESEGLVRVNETNKALSFSAPGNQLAYFPLTVGERAGIAKFSVTGNGNGESASQEIEIDIRNPNSFVSRSKTITLAPGETKTIPYTRFGVPGTWEADLELSALPAMNLSRHLRYLLRYPYGCVEQTVSPAFAQLYLDRVTELTPQQEEDRKNNVNAGLRALRNFQTSTGGMAYWPGNGAPHPWASSYAMHFLVEAERAGYAIPVDLKQKLVKFQKAAARDWRDNTRNFYASSAQLQRDQAYRLYVLALAGNAEIGSMNRLKSKTGMPASARFQLAAAYSLVGQQAAAKELMGTADPTVKKYRELGYTFGSDIRDMAMILEAQLAVNDQGSAAKQVFRLAERIGSRRWLSTQEAAFAFVAIGKMSEADKNTKLMADFTTSSGGKTSVGANTGIYQIGLMTNKADDNFVLKNTGTATLYATVITGGQPLPGEEEATSENLVLDISYTDEDGNAIDVSRLASGTDFIANYTVRNPGSLGMNYRQLALRSLVPSGWEISNERLDAGGSADEGGYNYRDFRDDRVFTFFHLNRGKSKTFSLRMTATYPGRYYLPGQLAEAMYADDVKAEVKGRWVEVSR